MKPRQILLFLLSVLLVLGLVATVWPEGGVRLCAPGGVELLTLRFPSLSEELHRDPAQSERLSAEEAVARAHGSMARAGLIGAGGQGWGRGSKGQAGDSPAQAQERARRAHIDTLRARLRRSPYAIHTPGERADYFDDFFRSAEAARRSERVVRVMHWGDSQIEIDRISSVLRERLQEQFGGWGVGFVPAVQTTPALSVMQQSTGALRRYIAWGNDPETRAPHHRLGMMMQVGHLAGTATIALSRGVYADTPKRAKRYERVGVLLSDVRGSVSLTLEADSAGKHTETLTRTARSQGQTQYVVLRLSRPATRVRLTLRGTADVQGISLDGHSGLTVDNCPMRGCAGTLFTAQDAQTLGDGLRLCGTSLLLLQFGGNAATGRTKPALLHTYCQQLRAQLALLRRVAPQAQLLFIGPGDMGQRQGGEMRSLPGLRAFNDSLRACALGAGVAYWDMFRVMGGENSMQAWVGHQPPWAGPDYIHFTPRGAAQIGTLLSDALLDHYALYRLRKGK